MSNFKNKIGGGIWRYKFNGLRDFYSIYLDNGNDYCLVCNVFKKCDNQPDLIVFESDIMNNLKNPIGAGWYKKSKNNNEYVFMVLNDEKYIIFKNVRNRNAKKSDNITVYKCD